MLNQLLTIALTLFIFCHPVGTFAQPAAPAGPPAAPADKTKALAQNITIVYGGPIEYVDSFLVEAQRLEKKQGIPASVLTALAILESGGFSSHLFEGARNPFGMKVTKGWNGPIFEMWHEGAMTKFRRYKTPRIAVEDFAAKLKSRRWFADAFKCPHTDAECFITALMPSPGEPGYSRDPEWGNKIRKIIKRFGLEELEQ